MFKKLDLRHNKTLPFIKNKTKTLCREVGGRFKREGTCQYQWLIHVNIWQKPTQYCKAIILQLKKNPA